MRFWVPKKAGAALFALAMMVLPVPAQEAQPIAGGNAALPLVHVENGQNSAAAQQAHRNYAKRQITWFRREPDVHWLAGFGDDGSIQAAAVTLVQEQSTISDRP